MMRLSIRKADSEDIDAVDDIYKRIHEQEKAGEVAIGWHPEIYPVRATAEDALKEGTLFVMVQGGKVVASAIINQKQPEAYGLPDWIYEAAENKVGVLHTLVVHPDFGHRGLGRIFVDFFEAYCKENGCEVVRLDTQEQNVRPLNFYLKVGYRLAGIYETDFQNLPKKIRLAMFEKKL